MKNCVLYFLLACLFIACSDDKGNTPKLELIGVFLNGGDEDYALNPNDIPPLTVGDKLDLSFELGGNGADLKTFIVKNESPNLKATMMYIDPEEISDEFTNLREGKLGYKDGVSQTYIVVMLRVNERKEEDAKISFFLSSKAANSEGASYHMQLKTTAEPRKK